MLQSINPSVQASLTSPGGEALPAGFAQAQVATGAAPAFDLQLAPHGFAEQSLEALPAPAAAAERQPASPFEPDAEQWLLSMLDQQGVRVEAREGSAQPAAATQAPPADAELSELPMPVVASVAEPVVQPARQAEATAPLPQVLPAGAAGAQPLAEAPATASLLATGNPNGALDGALLERLPAASGDAETGAPPAVAPAQPAPHAAAAERSLKLQAPQAQWGEQMLHSLREHVELQINQRIQSATIRLDPPELGSLEIYLSHESGRLNVQLSAANGEVARLLQQTSERLRQELVGQNFVQVNVQVSADAQGGRQHGQAPRQAWLGDEPVQAARHVALEGGRDTQEPTGDVLVTV